MDKLMICAVAYRKLINTRYHCVIGRKGIKREFVIGFSPYEFHHLCGLLKLPDIPALRGNRERVYKDILSGKITYEMISKSGSFNLISDRLSYLSRLEEFLDSNLIIFSYDKRNSKASRIEAKYLLQNTMDDEVVYFFIGEQKYDEALMGVSFFLKDKLDYSIAQPRWTLLYKSKKLLDSDSVFVQYDRLTGANE